ncbi:MAG: hypothetical protein ABIR53_03360 [Paraperlucidibaca sp.]
MTKLSTQDNVMFALKAFAAGFIATLLFHQGLFNLFYSVGMVAVPAFNMTPSHPLGVPAVISLAFWGGLWGWPVAYWIRHSQGAGYWLKAVLLGAIGPTAVAMLIVFPLKGLPVETKTVIGGLLLNGAWGLGVAIFMRWPSRRHQAKLGT